MVSVIVPPAMDPRDTFVWLLLQGPGGQCEAGIARITLSPTVGLSGTPRETKYRLTRSLVGEDEAEPLPYFPAGNFVWDSGTGRVQPLITFGPGKKAVVHVRGQETPATVGSYRVAFVNGLSHFVWEHFEPTVNSLLTTVYADFSPEPF